MNTIREKIILAMLAKLAEAITANYYNLDCGSNVFRCRQNVEPSELPCFVVWPQPEEVTIEEYHQSKHIMPVRIEGISLFNDTNPSVISEQILNAVQRF